MADVVEEPKTEDAFRAWLRDHPNGFVLNAWAQPAEKPEHARGVTWHRSDCTYLGADRRGPFVTGDTIKACADELGDLLQWAIERTSPPRRSTSEAA